MSSELATIPPAQLTHGEPLGVLDVINNAVVNNASVEVLERLYALLERQNAAQAKRQFDEAMAGFQGECPVIVKSAEGARTRSGGVAYHYAPLDKIVSTVRGLLTKYGLSYSFDTIDGDTIEVICTVKHIGGHSEQSRVKFRLGAKTEIMSMTQQDAATVTYSKRYAFCNAFGIMTGDSDTDAMDITERSIYDEPGYRVVKPNPQTNTSGPQYKPPAQRTQYADPPLDLPTGVQHIGQVLQGELPPADERDPFLPAPSLPEGIESAQVCGGNAYTVQKTQLGVRFELQASTGKLIVFYPSLAKACDRSGMARPWEYKGTVTFRRVKERCEGQWDVDQLHFPELEATNV